MSGPTGPMPRAEATATSDVDGMIGTGGPDSVVVELSKQRSTRSSLDHGGVSISVDSALPSLSPAVGPSLMPEQQLVVDCEQVMRDNVSKGVRKRSFPFPDGDGEREAKVMKLKSDTTANGKDDPDSTLSPLSSWGYSILSCSSPLLPPLVSSFWPSDIAEHANLSLPASASVRPGSFSSLRSRCGSAFFEAFPHAGWSSLFLRVRGSDRERCFYAISEALCRSLKPREYLVVRKWLAVGPTHEGEDFEAEHCFFLSRRNALGAPSSQTRPPSLRNVVFCLSSLQDRIVEPLVERAAGILPYARARDRVTQLLRIDFRRRDVSSLVEELERISGVLGSVFLEHSVERKGPHNQALNSLIASRKSEDEVRIVRRIGLSVALQASDDFTGSFVDGRRDHFVGSTFSVVWELRNDTAASETRIFSARVDKIREFLNEEALSPSFRKHSESPCNEWRLLEDEGVVARLVLTFTDFENDLSVPYIHQLFVRPSFRRRGIGSFLVALCREFVFSRFFRSDPLCPLRIAFSGKKCEGDEATKFLHSLKFHSNSFTSFERHFPRAFRCSCEECLGGYLSRKMLWQLHTQALVSRFEYLKTINENDELLRSGLAKIGEDEVSRLLPKFFPKTAIEFPVCSEFFAGIFVLLSQMAENLSFLFNLSRSKGASPMELANLTKSSRWLANVLFSVNDLSAKAQIDELLRRTTSRRIFLVMHILHGVVGAAGAYVGNPDGRVTNLPDESCNNDMILDYVAHQLTGWTFTDYISAVERDPGAILPRQTRDASASDADPEYT